MSCVDCNVDDKISKRILQLLKCGDFCGVQNLTNHMRGRFTDLPLLSRYIAQSEDQPDGSVLVVITRRITREDSWGEQNKV